MAAGMESHSTGNGASLQKIEYVTVVGDLDCSDMRDLGEIPEIDGANHTSGQ
jgi:hypothetical protein